MDHGRGLYDRGQLKFVTPSRMSASINPSATALTRSLSATRASAKLLVSPIMPGLLAAQAIDIGLGRSPAIEATCTLRPKRRSIMPRLHGPSDEKRRREVVVNRSLPTTASVVPQG